MFALMLLVRSRAWRWTRAFRAGRNALGERDYAEAEKRLRGALELGGSRGQRAAAQAALAEALYGRGRLDEASSLVKRAIELFADCFPAGHPEIARAYSLHGELCLDRGEYAQAQRCFQHALAEDQRISNQARMLFTMQRLTEALLLQGNQPRALAIAEDCAVLERVFMEDIECSEPYVAMSLPGLSFCQGDWETARRLYREKVDFFECFSGDIPGVDTGQYQMRLAAACEGAGDPAEAAGFYQAAAATYQRSLAEDHPRVAIALVRSARLLEQSGDAQQAREVYAEARGIFAQHGLSDHPELASTARAA
jgi:tetratricopeptide (TPR) repeat protein